MHVNVKEFLQEADLQEPLYPGKRIVKPCKQVGEYRNHCVVIDWRDPSTLSVEIKPGLSGKHLAPEMVKQYPVSFQMPTYVKIDTSIDAQNDNDEDEDGEEGKSKGKRGESGGGGKKMTKNMSLDDIEMIAARFSDKAEGKIPELGKIKEMMIMGVQLAKESFATAFSELTKQINHAKVTMTEVLAKAANIVTRVSPPEYIKPTGNETTQYKYDREKNADIGMTMRMG